MAESAGAAEGFNRFVADVEDIVSRDLAERDLAEEVAVRLRDLLAGSFDLPAEFCRAVDDGYVMYPLYVDAQGRFSVAAAVWGVGQATPVHGHETWGVVGIYSGIEGETRYVKPVVENIPLEVAARDLQWRAGDVTVCCTTDDDVHRVECVGNSPCIGIHVYGADIGSLPRRRYDPATGEITWFTSTWARANS